MSIFLGALGGAGEAMGQVGNTMLQSELAKDRDSARLNQESDLTLARAKAMELFKQSLTDADRVSQVQRVDAAAGKIADTKVAGKRAAVEAGIVDRASWTPEQQAAVDQSMQTDREAVLSDPNTRTQAAITTGDISPKDAAAILHKDDALLYKALWEQQKEEGRNDRSDARIAAQADATDKRLAASAAASDKRLAYLFASLEKRGEKKAGADTAKEALQFLDGSRKEVTAEAQNLRQLYTSQIKDKSPAAVAKIDAEYQPKFADVERKRREIEEDYNHVRERVGLPSRGGAAPAAMPGAAPAAAPKPSAGTVQALPPGSRQIGTSGGKPVYQTPDGKKFVAQ